MKNSKKLIYEDLNETNKALKGISTKDIDEMMNRIIKENKDSKKK